MRRSGADDGGTTGDYVHMINPNDATRPIVGQVWKTWVPTKGNTQQHHLTVCWYYRPEQVGFLALQG